MQQARSDGAIAEEAPGRAADPYRLIEGLLLGLGFAELPQANGETRESSPAALSHELMRRIGELLAASTRGTVALLQARATF